jgi:predicted nucleotidyltransferase
MLRTRSSGSVQITWVDLPELLAAVRERAERLCREHPEIQEILLFGSLAHGGFTPDSDIDLLIILERSDTPFLERADPYRDIFSDLPFDVFPLVYTRDEVDRMQREGNPFLRSALEGAVSCRRDNWSL